MYLRLGIFAGNNTYSSIYAAAYKFGYKDKKKELLQSHYHV
jgi:hypothetical protein